MFYPIQEPLIKYNIRDILASRDIYSLSILSIYTLFAIIFYVPIENASSLIFINILIGIGIISVATLSNKYKAGRIFYLLHRLYIIPLIYIMYRQSQEYVKVINVNLYDSLLIRWDYLIFGVNPTEWISQFYNPLLTEVLMISYMLFYFMPILHGIEHHYRKNDYEFRYFSRTICFGFYLSYLLYIILPAIGPRFALHDFFSINDEMPGIFLTNLFRDFINAGGSIPPSSLSPAEVVNRDCMPSGHTMMTLINIIIAFKTKSYFKWFFLVVGSSLIISTIYLRYHYAVDLIAGALLALAVLKFEPYLYSFLEKRFIKSI